MSTPDRTAAVVRGEPPDDPDPEAARAALRADTRLDGALAARLRDESRRTRAGVERRLVTAGHLADDGTPLTTGDADDTDDRAGVDDVDAWRDLGDMLDEHVDLLERIDALHERRLRSPSPRERQAATRILAEALHRVVDGYDVEAEPSRGPVAAAERADDWFGRQLVRAAGLVRRPASGLRWWARNGRWVRLGLALVASALLAAGALGAAALVVAVRSVSATSLFAPDLPDARPGRVLGYDPAWAACVCTHLGDAAVLAGLGLGLHVGGHSGWGATTAFAALFSLLATMLRVASGHHGFRLSRLWVDRVVVTVALAVATAGVAVSEPGEPGVVGGVPVTILAVAAVAAIGVLEISRTVYWAFRRRRLFRHQPRAGGGPVPDVLVARTADAVVMNISRRRPPRARVLHPSMGPADTGGPHLRVVEGGGAPG